MIRFFRAFAWLRWRVARNAFRTRGGRDSLERFSRIGAVLAPILLAALLVPLSIALAGLAAWGGAAVAHDDRGRGAVLLAARAVLGAATAALVLGPIVRSMSGSVSSLGRLVLLPIPRRGLFAAEVFSGVVDPWFAVPVPALVLFCAGIAWGGMPGTALVAVAATILLLVVWLVLAATVAFVVQLLFRDRRRGEALSLVAAVLLALVGFVPMLLHETFENRKGGESAAVRELARDGRGRGALVLTQALPSELWSRSIRASAEGSPMGAVGALGGLAAGGVLLLVGAAAAHRRLLDSPAEGSGKRGTRSGASGPFLFPGLSPGGSAVAWAQARTLLRTLVGKMAVFLNPVLVLLLAFVAPRVASDLPLDRLPTEPGVLFAAAGAVFALLSLERILLNQFAVDGAGFTLQLLAPLSERELVLGKMAGAGLLGALSYGIFLALLVPMVGGIGPLPLLACVLGLLSAYLPFAPIAAILAAVLPRTADLTRIGSASNPHGVANLLGFVAGNALCAPPASLYFFGAVLRGSPALGCALVAAWAAIASLLTLPLVGLAADTLAARRENVALVAQGR